MVVEGCSGTSMPPRAAVESARSSPAAPRLLRWNNTYREADLYKAAVRVYTKPLFQWRKALHTSTDGKTLYDLAADGLRGLEALHRLLRHGGFEFRPAVALKYNFNGKRRTLYIPPWEERIVDLLLYRLLNRKLHRWFSPNSYAYRNHSHGLDQCQRKIAQSLRSTKAPRYLVKRDISEYFASVNHESLLDKLAQLVDEDDYLFRLLEQRVRFAYDGVRNVAILDYYLKHVSDESQLPQLDRWLAEEVLSLVFGGHKKGHFSKITFEQLRQMGLPSLFHRRRQILNGRIASPFFIWQRQKATRAFRGTVARLLRTQGANATFSPVPEAAATKRP
jgi:hypothetical protein